MKKKRHKQEQHTQQKRDIKIIEYGSIIIAEEHNITPANTFPGDDEKEEFGVVIIQGSGNLVIRLAPIDAFLFFFFIIFFVYYRRVGSLDGPSPNILTVLRP